jgi:hypothetical protein
MTLSITCPVCDAAFTPANDLRGKKAFCPRCGWALVVTSAGVAKVNEANRPAPAGAPPALGDGRPRGPSDFSVRWAFSPDGKRLATLGDSPNTITLWDVASGKALGDLNHGEPVMAVAFSKDGARVATSTGNLQPDFHVYLWELTDGNRTSPTDK